MQAASDVPSLGMESFRLQVFRAVAQHLNFRRAAEDLAISQPGVTQHIRALEKELGLPLFDRAGGRVALTGVGSILYRYAQQLKTLSDEALQAISEASGVHTGRLSLGASQTIGQYLLPNLMAAFLGEHPQVQLTAMSGNTDEVLEALAAHAIDLALIEGPTLRRDIATEPFMQDHLVLVAAKGHAWGERGISLDMLAAEPMLMRERGSGSRRVVEQSLEQAGLKLNQLRISMTLDSTEGLLSAVEAGLGTTFASRWAIRNQLSLGTLKVVPVKGLQVRRMFCLAYPSGPAPTGNAGAFYRFVLARSESLVPRTTGHPPRRSKAE